MSYKATNWAYELPLKGSMKPVLVALADMADEANSCFPGQKKIAGMTGLSVASVRRALDKLEDLGLLSRVHRHGQHGYRTSDRYQLHVDMTIPESLPLNMPTRQSAYKAECLEGTVQPPSAHSERAIEPSVEPSDISLKVGVTFDDFWKVWGKRVAKGDARAAWGKAIKKADPSIIIEAARQLFVSPGDMKFIPYPATWLNREQWADEVQAPAKPADVTPMRTVAELNAHRERMMRGGN